jgi:putative ABC transport system permease protein
VDHGLALRTVTLYGDSKALTSGELKGIQAMPRVASAVPVVATPVGLRETGSSITLVGWSPSTAPPMVTGTAQKIATGEVVLPASADGVDLHRLLGQTVHLTYTVAATTNSGTTKDVTLRVVGLSDPTYQVDGPLTGYASLPLVTGLAADRAGVPVSVLVGSHGYEKVLVVTRTPGDVGVVVQDLQRRGIHAVSVLQELDALPGVISLIRMVTAALYAALVLVGLIAAVTVTHTLCRQRAVDVAILKAYGWQRRRIQTVLTAEAAAVCAAALTVGVSAGLAAARPLGGWLRSRLSGSGLGPVQLPWLHVLGGAGLTLVVLVLGVSLAVGRASRASVADILRRI